MIAVVLSSSGSLQSREVTRSTSCAGVPALSGVVNGGERSVFGEARSDVLSIALMFIFPSRTTWPRDAIVLNPIKEFGGVTKLSMELALDSDAKESVSAT